MSEIQAASFEGSSDGDYVGGAVSRVLLANVRRIGRGGGTDAANLEAHVEAVGTLQRDVLRRQVPEEKDCGRNDGGILAILICSFDDRPLDARVVGHLLPALGSLATFKLPVSATSSTLLRLA